jgi:hypothetical protein
MRLAGRPNRIGDKSGGVAVNRRATDVDRAVSAIGGIALNYVSFGPRRPPETSSELREIFAYNEFGEAEYRPPVEIEAETEEFPPLPGLPEVAEPAQAAPVHNEAPAYREPLHHEPAPQVMMPPPVAAPFVAPPPVYQPPAQPEIGPEPRPAPPAYAAPVSAPSAVPDPRFAPPPAVRPLQPEPAPLMATADNFGLPEIWRDRRDASNAHSAPVADERALAAMFRMLGNKAHGGIAGVNAEEEQSRRTNNELFRRL